MTLFLFIDSKTIENLISSKKKVLENYDCDDDNYDNNEKYDNIRNDSNATTTTVEPRLSGLDGTSVKSPDNRESG